MTAARETSHVRHARRELQDATALRTIVACHRTLCAPLAGSDDAATNFALDVMVAVNGGWMDGTLTDRLRLAATDPVARAAQATGLFTWGRGQRFRNSTPAPRRAEGA